MSARRTRRGPVQRPDTLPRSVPHLGGTAEMDAAIEAVARSDEAFRVPYLVLARDGDLAFAMPARGEPIHASFLELRRPRLVVLSDGHPGATGPDAWPQAAKLLRWTAAAVLQAGAGNPFRSAVIGEATIRCGRMLLVEVQQRHMEAWGRLAERELPRLQLHRFVPKDGERPIGGAPPGAVLH